MSSALGSGHLLVKPAKIGVNGAWTVYDWCRNSATNFHNALGYKARFLMAFMKLLSLGIGILVVLNISNSLGTTTQVSTKSGAWCTREKSPPAIIMCPKPYANRTYGLVINESLVQKLNLDSTEVDMLSEWKMTGLELEKSNEIRVLSKVKPFGFESLEVLWTQLMDLETHLYIGPMGSVAAMEMELFCWGTAYNFSKPDVAACIDTNYGNQRKTKSVLCPAYEKFRNPENEWTKRKRRIWNTNLKSRCLFMEQHTHPYSHWLDVGIANRYGYWVWFGDLGITKLEGNWIEAEPGQRWETYTAMYEVKSSDSPPPTVCHHELKYDGGMQYQCPLQEKASSYWIYHNSLVTHKRRKQSLFRFVATALSYNLEDKKPFNTLTLTWFALATIDMFIGFSIFYFFAFVLTCLKNNKIVLAILKSVVILTLLGLSSLMVYREWNNIVANWYSKVFQKNLQEELEVPTLAIRGYKGNPFYNYSKFNELQLTVPIFMYIMAVGKGEFSRLDLDVQLNSAEERFVYLTNSNYYSSIKETCQTIPSNSSGCRLEVPFWQLVETLSISPYRNSSWKSMQDMLTVAYGERYAAHDYDSFTKKLHAEYLDLMAALGISDLEPHKLLEVLRPDLCQIILSCTLNGKPVPHCCNKFYIDKLDSLVMYNNFKDRLVQRQPGRHQGFMLRLNLTLLQQLSDISQWNGVLLNAKTIQSHTSKAFSAANFKTTNRYVRLSITRRKVMWRNHDIVKSMAPEQYANQLDRDGLRVDFGFIKFQNEKAQHCQNFSLRKLQRWDCHRVTILKQHMLVNKCKCKFCNPEWPHDIWTKIPCCSPLQMYTCVTQKAFYSPHCRRQSGFDVYGTELNGFLSEWLSSQLEYFTRCYYNEWRKRDPGNEFVNYLNASYMDELESILGYDFYKEDVWYFCQDFCVVESLPSVDESVYPLKGKPGILEFNAYYAYLNVLQIKEEPTFYPFQFAAIFFGVWSVFFNQPFLMILLNIALFLKKVWLYISGQATLSDLLTSDHDKTAVKSDSETPINIVKYTVSRNIVSTELQSNHDEKKTESQNMPGAVNHDVEERNHKSLRSPEEKPEDVTDCQNPPESHQQSELGKAKYSSKNTNFNTVHLGESPVNISQIGKFGKPAFGVLVYVSVMLLVGSFWFFLEESLHTEPYVHSMKVSVTESYPIPSVALCTHDKTNIVNLLNKLNGICQIEDYEALECTSLFRQYYHRSGLSCVIQDNNLTNANVRQFLLEKDKMLHFSWALRASANVKSVKIYIYVGDIFSLSSEKPLIPLFIWEPQTSMTIRFRTDRILNPASLCHRAEKYLTKCKPCGIMKSLFESGYTCCLGSQSQGLPMKIPDVPSLESLKSVPCSSYEYLTWEVVDADFVSSRNMTGELKLQIWDHLLTSYIKEDRFSLRSLFIFLSTYWGMLMGISMFQICVAAAFIIMYLVEKMKGCLSF